LRIGRFVSFRTGIAHWVAVQQLLLWFFTHHVLWVFPNNITHTQLNLISSDKPKISTKARMLILLLFSKFGIMRVILFHEYRSIIHEPRVSPVHESKFGLATISLVGESELS